MFYSKYSEKINRIKSLEKAFNNESFQVKNLKAAKDSLSHINYYLSRFRALTDAMWYRDSLRIPLKYKVGDKVILKRDSAKVVITDIIIGGSQHDFYIKYRVTGKDKMTEEIVPELIY